MRTSSENRTRTIVLGTASKQTRGAEGLFTDDVLKSRIAAGLAAE